MALNVSNGLMLLVQQIKRKQLVHITILKMNHIKLACLLRAELSLLEGTKIDALMAFPLESCSVKEALETIYNLAT